MELGLLVFLTVFAVVGWSVLRRPDPGPAAFWSWACVDILGSGLSTAVAGQASWALPVGWALGTAYPALLLAGALAYAGRTVPWWLVPPALALGAARAGIAIAGWPGLAQVMALVVEVPLVVAAAWLVWGATRPGATPAQLALAPALLAFSAIEVATSLTTVPGVALPLPILGLWVLGAPLLLVLQVTAASDRSQDVLRRSRDELERRVEERTAELAASVGELEQQVAERRAAEAALRVSEERYRLVSELSSDYSFEFRVDAEGRLRIVWSTGALSRITGYEAEEIDGEGWLDLIRPVERDDALERMRRIGSPAGPPSRDFRIVTKSGEERWLAVRVATVVSESDGSLRVVGAARDVTDRKLAERERQRLDRHVAEVQRLESLGLLAGGIAHDFNNLLTVILGNARLAEEELGPDVPAHARIGRIQSAARFAAGLTEQILTHAGQSPVELEPLDLSGLTRDMLDLLRATMSPKGRLEPELAADLPAIEGDPARLRQLLLNLVGNASAALGDDSGTVSVRTGRLRVDEAGDLDDAFGTPNPHTGVYVTLEVSDTGCGIEPDVQDRIFEPFFSTRDSGRGLGLAVVLGIVRAHDGLIRLRSERGFGTTFQVLLPATSRVAALAPAEAAAAPAPAGGHVLVVDDDEAVVELASEFLARAGFRVSSASGGEGAIAVLRADPAAIDAVVIDLAMPGLGGEEVLETLRSLRPGLPAVIATGFDREHVASRMGESGASTFLAKPYAPEELVDAVSRVRQGGAATAPGGAAT